MVFAIVHGVDWKEGSCRGRRGEGAKELRGKLGLLPEFAAVVAVIVKVWGTLFTKLGLCKLGHNAGFGSITFFQRSTIAASRQWRVSRAASAWSWMPQYLRKLRHCPGFPRWMWMLVGSGHDARLTAPLMSGVSAEERLYVPDPLECKEDSEGVTNRSCAVCWRP